MLDWMKKLFNKEEEQTAMNKEVPKQIESQPKIPRVNHYTEAREAQMASRNAGKCRFPLVPDNGFDEEDESEVNRFEEQPVQGVAYEEPTAQRGIKVERSRRPYVEKVVSTYEEPEVQYEPVRESVVKKASAPSQESNRRPFRPTEMISPIYGYNRPSVEKKVEKQEEVKEREDLEISVEGKSVVDAWLEKKGYKLSDFSEGQAPTSSSHRAANQQGEQQYEENKKEEKSVVDQWLEKNGYEIERQVPLVEEKEVIKEMSTPQEVSADELLHKTVAEQMESAKLEKDVVVLNENNLQEELVASKVEHEDTILSEEIKRNTEIKQPTIKVEKQAPEESVIVKAEEKLEETIIVEIPEEVSKVEVIAETEELEEVVMETEAPEEVEAEGSEEVEVIAETEEVEVIAETKEPEEVVMETEEVEVIAEAEEVEVIAEAKESEEVEVIAEAKESEEVEVIAEAKESEEVEVIAETEESEEVEVIAEAKELEEVEVITETEESEEVEVIAEAEETEVIAETKAPVVETFVALEEIQQEDEAIEQKSEFIHVAEADEQTKKDVQSFANVLIAETEENRRVVEEAQVAEEQRVVEEAPVVEEQRVVEEAPVVEEQRVVEETPIAEEQPVVQKEEPKREKKRHVPFNVVMLKQDRTRLMERHAARANAMQPSANVRVENKPVQQEVAEPQVEERPVQQVVAEPQVEENPMQQVVAEPQVEERPVQQVVVEQVQKPISSTEVQEKAYVVNQRENDMRNVLHTPPTYTVPPLALLSIPQQSALDNTEWLEEQKELLDTTFNNFHVGAHVINVSQGPAVTRFEVQPDPGVKVNKITNLSDDIKLSLAAKDIRIEAPIPGKSAIGIEVPNKESKPVFLREILRSPVFTKSESPLTVALGLDISGEPIVTDIRKMPHGLIAGATGSGKSVCINAILTSILYKAKPHEVKLMLIDPKMVELAPYNSVPHLVAPVITDVKAATAALKWAVEEMERRYELFAHAGARDLTRYNTIVSEREIPGETLPYIVIVIDELADLMMVAPGDVEEAICRIAQKARACGIHLLVATQRPSVDVITGLIKSNIPTRIAFTVSSQVDSRTIIDIGGAEKLLGRGDMLFLGNGTSKPVRVQGVYVSDDEIEKTVDHVKKQMKPNYLFKQEDLLAKTEQAESEDELFLDACQFVVEQGGASTSSVQRKFRIGYNRAARLIEEMESQGIISEGRGTKPRDVLISEDEFAAMQETNV
ncbi:cell division protein FtsK [Bacillus thuringiensis serovar tolworthi]|uniref:Cell division protein FtsK n=3 Tax=Bacillus cereus group TaxID=86661 RepID=A0A9W3ZTK4_BACTO|nr:MULTISPECIES: DNA translocase FtsK [Bacillus cereus group]MEB8711766.1 DNA translocase FtsK [Bacillus cereus]MEB9430751.1 DNA translocase FtsK [Bacillus cereus]MEB9478051.1 DNA translocase FtsK [Bacillus cereus]MEB9592699.1 DNA translocase FtsK [Bacillus cereus]BAR81752.1 cell division protein FtsK [Bacillus thuringiensis serovar tolworthi]